MTRVFTIFFLFLNSIIFAQDISPSLIGQKISFTGDHEINYKANFKKGGIYLIQVYQENIDVEISLYDEVNQKILSTDLADGNKGTDKLEYAPSLSGVYRINIKSVSPKPIQNGMVRITLDRLSQAEILRRRKIAKGLEAENAKNISSVDIIHFWEAFDALKEAKTYGDSVKVIQRQYLDRATNGLKEFMKVRYFSAEFYTDRIKKYNKFYRSVRANTQLFLSPEKLSDIIEHTRLLYPEGKPAKVALTIGPMSSGGTISNDYVLIGLEMIAGDKNCNVSEITNENLKSDILSRSDQAGVQNFVHETIAHEYIHTQQRPIKTSACQCILLEQVIKEGVASFISESLIMRRKHENKSRAAVYASANEESLWKELKGELCATGLQNWLYNAAGSKKRPGDLGYRIGYKIAESFYINAADKNTAVKEMVETDNPLLFLDKSKYDLKFR